MHGEGRQTGLVPPEPGPGALLSKAEPFPGWSVRETEHTHTASESTCQPGAAAAGPPCTFSETVTAPEGTRAAHKQIWVQEHKSGTEGKAVCLLPPKREVKGPKHRPVQTLKSDTGSVWAAGGVTGSPGRSQRRGKIQKSERTQVLETPTFSKLSQNSQPCADVSNP